MEHKHTVGPDRQQQQMMMMMIMMMIIMMMMMMIIIIIIIIIIQCMHSACWITKATDTHSEYVA